MSSYSGYNYPQPTYQSSTGRRPTYQSGCQSGCQSSTGCQSPSSFDDMFDDGVYRAGRSLFRRRGTQHTPRTQTHYTQYTSQARETMPSRSINSHISYMHPYY